MSDPLDELRNLGDLPVGAHLDDETIALLASAETLGEDISHRYPAEVAHLETCVTCVDAYAELVELSLREIVEMAMVADQIPPEEVFAAMLIRAGQAEFDDLEQLRNLARRIAAALPARYAAPPTQDEISERLFLELAEEAGTPISLPQARSLSEHVRAQLSALALFLQGIANQAWGRALEVLTERRGQRELLRLQPGAPLTVPVLGDASPAGETWILTRTRVGEALPLNVSLRARRLSDLACLLEVAVDRPGLRDASGRTVQVYYGDQARTQTTDSSGTARFESVPIAALSKLEIEIQA